MITLISEIWVESTFASFQTNSLSCVVYYSGASRNQNEALCVLRASQVLTRRTRSISVISVLWLLSRGGHRGTTDARISNHSESTLGPVRLNKNTMCEVQLVSQARWQESLVCIKVSENQGS
jgi:hypothetical protein